ncbi:MAG: heme exporter protein CcmB [Pyrinomonadaceae bacterium]|jgi:heme exporter protein B|nr:heme exporter protein CcmB [Pyrinomonadaceae bacterium]MDQ3174022.1 heme exporter protein CcmB [Acidobacteriota bacterium]
MFRWIVVRDLTLAWKGRVDVLSTLFFFLIVVSLFPLGIGPETHLLRLIAPGVVWVAALLASMLSLGRLFANDYQDGTLEQLLLTPQPLYLVVLGKVLALWLVSGVPLTLLSPVLGIQFGLSRNTLFVLVVSLLLGTPVLALIGSIGAALTLGLRGGGLLISILVLPLYIPVLIFGAGAVDASIMGSGVQGSLSFLGTLVVLSLVFAPWAAAAALRISLE